MYQRSLGAILKRYASIYPILGITGPRQSGKTTLARFLFSSLPYVSLENLDTRTRAIEDPRAFLESYKQGAIFDEVQHTPDLLSYLQGMVDADPQMGQFVITGSQNFALTHHISQSLSGRIGMVTLLPLSYVELDKSIRLSQFIFQGGYPGLYQREMTALEFFPSYIQTYIERDVRQIKNIENYTLFQNFLKLCAGRTGQVINLSSLAQDCGISHTTARQWLSVLEASYIIFFLHPYYQNFSKRLIKMPKLYFYDTGLACHLLGLEKEQQLETHYLKGALFENAVILEILKGRLNRGQPPNLYFWRDHAGHEVDLLAEWGGNLKAIEIKSGATFQSNQIKNIEYFCNIAPNAKGVLVSLSSESGKYSNITLLPMQDIESIYEL